MEGDKCIKLRAEMTCEGCSNAITRILKKVEGIKEVNCSIPEQEVTVYATEQVDPSQVLQKLTTWAEASGKQVSLIS